MLDLTSQTKMMTESNDNSGLWFIYEPRSSFLQQVGYLFILNYSFHTLMPTYQVER